MAQAGDDQLKTHVENTIGEIAFLHKDTAWKETEIDVLHVVPRPGKNYHTLITDGMSRFPMTPPEDAEDQLYAELVLCLPPDWPTTTQALGNKSNFWPFDLLAHLGEMPHRENTWLWFGHTVPNGEQAVPYIESTELCCSLLIEPVSLDERAAHLQIDDSTTISFFGVMPLYIEEMEFLFDSPIPDLLARFPQNDIYELLHPTRKNVCE